MLFTTDELEFLEENKELVKEGEKGLEELLARVFRDQRVRTCVVGFLVVYNVLGPNGFILDFDSEVINQSGFLEDVLLNRVEGISCKGIPLLPNMYKNQTKVVLYKLEGYRVPESETISLTSRQELMGLMAQKGYNLVTLDTKKAKDSLERYLTNLRIFFKIDFKAKVDLKIGLDFGGRGSVYVDTDDTEEEINNVVVSEIVGRLTRYYKCEDEGFLKIARKVIDTLYRSKAD